LNYLLLSSLSLALLAAVIVLLRERRLRLALQRLVFRLMQLWRKNDPSSEDDNPDGGGGAAGGRL